MNEVTRRLAPEYTEAMEDAGHSEVALAARLRSGTPGRSFDALAVIVEFPRIGSGWSSSEVIPLGGFSRHLGQAEQVN